ncbi:MAG: DUF4381 domain-containing protein [Marinicellaceae bacterium]
MDKTAPVLELRDIHLPADPSIWPLAPGWWILIILSMVVIYFLMKKIIQIRHTKHLNNLMQQALTEVRNAYKKHDNKHLLAIDISNLLNRFVVHVLNDSQGSTLTGTAWIDYLNKRVSKNVFDDFKKELTQAQYQKHIDYDASRLIATVKNYFPQAIKYQKKYNKLMNKQPSKGVSNA